MTPSPVNGSGDEMPRFDQAPLHACDAVRWPALTTEEGAVELDRLAGFVDWLTDRYNLDRRTIPACWTTHGALVEELSALHTAWLTATTFGSGGQHILTWHQQFADTRRRLRDWHEGLGCGHDHPRRSPPLH